MKKILTFIICVFIVSDSFTQWIQISSAPTEFINNIIDVNGTLYICHSYQGIYKSIDGGIIWQQINTGLNNNSSKTVFEVIFYDGNLYAATFDGIYKSTNEGNEWTKKSNGIVIDPSQQSEYTVSIFEYNDILFTGAYTGIYESGDGAENWIVTNITGQNVLAKNFTEHNGILFAARESNNQPFGYKSTDGGLTWESLTSLLVPTISFFSESTNLWAGTVHAVWLSTDNGENWDLRENGLPPDPYNSWVIRVNGMLMSSLLNAAVFISTNEGINWEDYSQGLPTAISVRKLITYNDKNIAATSQGVWQRDTSEVITSPGNEIFSLQEFKLLQNYPNPFNPSTAIDFLIPELSFVTFKIYDVMGNEIANLINEEKPNGSYTVEFDASRLPSGVYFYKLRAGKFVKTRKMVLIK